MKDILNKLENALGMYADGFWTENDAIEEIDNILEEFFNRNREDGEVIIC